MRSGYSSTGSYICYFIALHPKSAIITFSGPLADITNISAAESKNKVIFVMDDSVEGSTPKSSTMTGALVDLTNLSAGELKKKRARDKYALLTVDQKKDIVHRNRENRQRRNENSNVATGNESMHPVTTPARLQFLDNDDGSCIVPSTPTNPLLTQALQHGDSTSSIPNSGNESVDPFITPRRLPFTDKSHEMLTSANPSLTHRDNTIDPTTEDIHGNLNT
uniref:Uncharacterized protein n=1 Tax=Leersia perrieri TaxID=77586 RepID=A0A0D9W7N8_9ORYZ